MIKRSFDLLISAITFILLLPVLLLIAVAIKLDSPGPIIFKQKRVGLHNQLFTIYKFRTMRIDTPDVPTHLLGEPAQYVSRLGGWLRKTSLDELPQLVNIMLGQMTLVGPRPALYNQTELIELRTAYGVHKVKPGLTGWAQINGRDELSDLEKAQYDQYYVEHRNLLFDLKILTKTCQHVVSAKGVRTQ
jgi:O-antigen biosynthesis protein WbqP